MQEEEEQKKEEEDLEEEEEEEEEGRVCGGMRDTVKRMRTRTLAHLALVAYGHV